MQRTRVLILGGLAALIIALFAPAIASAHWVGRTITTNGAWWAIHYDMPSNTNQLEFFNSYGNGVPYYVDIYNPTYGELAVWGPYWIQGSHNTVNYFGTYLAGNRCRIRTIAVPVPYNVGFYCKDAHI